MVLLIFSVTYLNLTACRIQQSTGEILKLEANLAKVLLGFVILEGSDDFLQQKTAVDNGLQTIDRYRPNHVFLICSAAGNRRCLQVLRIPKALWQGLPRALRSPLS